MHSPVTTHVPSDDGVEVAVHDFGGDGPPLVFVHGTGLCSRMWEPIIERLPAGRVRPLAVDLRGHGATRTPADVTFTDHRMVTDLTAVVNHFEVASGAVVGHSMGGATSMLTAHERPDAFARVWAYEPIIFPLVEPAPDEYNQMLEATRRRREVFPDRATVIERYGSRFPLDELDPACLAAYVQHGFLDEPDGTVRLACAPETEARAYEDFLQHGWDLLPDMTIDVRVAYGERMVDRAGQSAPSIAERLPNGHGQCFPGAAHFGPFGSIELAVESIVEWCIDRAEAPR